VAVRVGQEITYFRSCLVLSKSPTYKSKSEKNYVFC